MVVVVIGRLIIRRRRRHCSSVAIIIGADRTPIHPTQDVLVMRRGRGSRGVGADRDSVVVLATVESDGVTVVVQGVLIPWNQPTTTDGTAEAIQVVDPMSSPHHQVSHRETKTTSNALDAKQPIRWKSIIKSINPKINQKVYKSENKSENK